jgi:hypothetical protein
LISAEPKWLAALVTNRADFWEGGAMKSRCLKMVVLAVFALGVATAHAFQDSKPPLEGLQLFCEYKPPAEIANGKRIVLLAGDEEYRSEEALPMLGKLLSQHHGFHCMMLFSINPQTGEIDPNNQTYLPGLCHLEVADLMIISYRFRAPPDYDMRWIDRYVSSGKPILGLRTATHAFRFPADAETSYAQYSFDSKDNPGGFGRQYLGETWIAHHGKHGSESTRGVVEPANAEHPILSGVEDVWGPTDVYTVTDLPEGSVVLMRGAILKGMEPTDAVVEDERNNPMMPLVWIRERDSDGRTQRIFTTTMGSSTDFESADLRRLVVNGALWCMGLEDRISTDLNVDIVGEYQPTPFGFNSFQTGKFPRDHNLPDQDQEPNNGHGD